VTAWFESKDYLIQPDGLVTAVHLTMYFNELRTAWHENKTAKEKEVERKQGAKLEAKAPLLPLPLTVFSKHRECIAQKCTHLDRLPPLASHYYY